MTWLIFAAVLSLSSSAGASIPSPLAPPVDLRSARTIGGTQIVGDTDPAIWSAVLDLLPVRPSRIIVLDSGTLSSVARQKVRGFDAFVVAGNAAIFVLRQGMTLRNAETGDAFDRAVLASMIHHEMSHVGGLDERGAVEAEQDLWRRWVAGRRVDFALGLAYLHRLSEERQKQSQQDRRSLEVSTEELTAILAAGGATVLDARPALEYAISHIPGAVNVAPKAGVPMSSYVSDVAEIDRLLQRDRKAPLILYCNGPHCGKSRRLAEELRSAGYLNVRRYQLGIPFWRAAGRVCQIELEGIGHVLANDRTAVVIDVREASDFATGAIAGARNIPRSLVLEAKDTGEVRRAKDDGRLPMDDHNTRIIVLGANTAAARFVAEAVAREAFHNVSYFAGTVEAVRQFVEGQRGGDPVR